MGSGLFRACRYLLQSPPMEGGRSTEWIMDVTNSTEADVLLKQPPPADDETSPPEDNSELISSPSAPDEPLEEEDSAATPTQRLKEEGNEMVEVADQVDVAAKDVGEPCLVLNEQIEGNGQEGEDPGEGSPELTGSGVITVEQNQKSSSVVNPLTGETRLTAPQVMATMGVEFAPLIAAPQEGLPSPQESLPTPPTTEEEAVVPQGGEVVKTSDSEGKVMIEQKKDDVKKGKEKVAKKSKKGRDSEYMGRTLSQALAGLETPEEKIAALCKKYAELLGEHKGIQREHKTQQKQLVLLQRDRDHLQSEHGRAILAKSKLESLCRELQRHNKTIKEESIQRSKEEDDKRKEVSNKFQQTINEITNQMQDNHTRNIRLKEENLELASKLKKLVEQYERREEHIEKIFKHKELETQLADAKLQQASLGLQEEQERHKREKALLLNEAAEAQMKCDLLQKQETQLKAQLAVYTEKFEEFQTTLTKSNEIFQTFKQEMDQMTKKIKKLEKETNMWRVRWEKSNKSLLNMAEERTLREKELSSLKNKLMRLENLCRALQAERNDLIGKARNKEGVLSSPSKAKKQVIEANCAPPKADTPPLRTSTGKENGGRGGTDGQPLEANLEPTASESSQKQSETESSVDNKVLVNGGCSHDDGPLAGVVNGDTGQSVGSGGVDVVVGEKGDIGKTEEGFQDGTGEAAAGVRGQSVDGVDTGGCGSSNEVLGEAGISECLEQGSPGDGGGIVDSVGEVDPIRTGESETEIKPVVGGICSGNIGGDSGEPSSTTAADIDRIAEKPEPNS